MKSIRLLTGFLLACLGSHTAFAAPTTYDLVIYGGTSAGVAAAVQAKRMGKSVVLIEPTRRLGGLTTGGLGQTDIGNKAAIGGIAREFYQGINRHYDAPTAWKWQPQTLYRDSGQTRTDTGEEARWTFEPSAALRVFSDWVRTNQIEVIYGERLERATGVMLSKTVPPRIEAIRMESGKSFQGRMFMDATYEGDLMASAKVSYTVGREANARYGETLNGIQPAQARFHQLVKGVSPYMKPGDPASGLLPHINPNGPGKEGDGDHRVQAYCFRMCLTDHPDNRIPFHKPEGYVALWYELLLRNYEAGEKAPPWINSSMPNRKTDTNNRLGVSTDFIGQNYDYPEASYAVREKIIAQHRLYQQGLMWTLANHPRIPEAVRKEVARWGMCKDEFTEGNGWQEQLYIREARRMVADLVMTQHHCQGREVAPYPVGLAAYTMDSHHQQRYIDADGHVRNEGDVEVGGFPPYPIGFRAIVPKATECANLLVPTCLSASHIAFGSIRMEPVFMVLAQSAATAAAHAIDEQVPVQQINQPKFRARLEADRQVLVWTAPAKPAATPKAAAQKLRIVTLGDSITKGVRPGVKAEETFAARLEAALRAEGVEASVTNVGIGGERTDQALKRLAKDVLAHKPSLVTIMYGTNDSYVDQGKNASRITVEEYRTNLAKLVDELRVAGTIPVLMTEPRWGKTAKLNGVGEHPNVQLEKYVAACRAVAKEKQTPLVDHYQHWTNAEAKGTDIGAWTTDQCHPNPEGHRVLAELMLPIVRAALPKSR